MRRISSATPDDSAGIDLNPMLDVVFILLIFFIVTASFLKENALNLGAKPSENSNSEVVQPVVIGISSSNDISVDNRRIDVKSVRAVLAQKQAENQSIAVVVDAHENAHANTYVQILDAANQANIASVSLKTHVN